MITVEHDELMLVEVDVSYNVIVVIIVLWLHHINVPRCVISIPTTRMVASDSTSASTTATLTISPSVDGNGNKASRIMVVCSHLYEI